MLDQKKIDYRLHDLHTEEKLSAVDASVLIDVPPSHVFKTILLMPNTGKGKPIAALVPANFQVDVKLVAALLHEKKVIPMKQDDAETFSGMLTGGISPLGLLQKPIRIMIDDSINTLNTVIISAGKRGWQLELKPSDLISICSAIVKPIGSPSDSE